METLEDKYKHYCNTVSKYGHPMSLQSLEWLSAFVQRNDFKRVADFGSGFSSFVLRSTEGNSRDVFSYDTDDAWLGKTKQYLADQGFLGGELIHYGRDKIVADLDFIIWDLGNKDFRSKEFLAVADKFGDAICLIDDCHDPRYLKMCHDLRDNEGYYIKELTKMKDEFGRYCTAISTDKDKIEAIYE